MMKKVWLVLLAVVLVFGLAVSCGSSGGGDDDEDGVFELPASIVLEENKYGSGYQFCIDGVSGKFIKDDEWELEIAFTVSRDVPVGLQIGLVDRVTGDWSPLTWVSDEDPYTTDALEKDTPYDFTGENVIKFTLLKSAGGSTPKHNSLMFQTEKEFSPQNSNSLTTDPNAPGPITVTFTKGTLTKKGAGEPEPPELYPEGVEGTDFDSSEGITSKIGAQGKAVFADGIIDLTDKSGSALFSLGLPTATATGGTKTITIKYVCKVTEGDPKLTLKDGGWNDIATANGTDGCNWYPTLAATDVISTLVLKEAWYADATETISFQRNGETHAFEIKIISVKME